MMRLQDTSLSRSPASLARLTRREQEVLMLIGAGLDNGAIADQLCVSKHTLQHHVTRIYAKLGGVTRAQAVLHAVRAGLVSASAPTG